MILCSKIVLYGDGTMKYTCDLNNVQVHTSYSRNSSFNKWTKVVETYDKSAVCRFFHFLCSARHIIQIGSPELGTKPGDKHPYNLWSIKTYFVCLKQISTLCVCENRWGSATFGSRRCHVTFNMSLFILVSGRAIHTWMHDVRFYYLYNSISVISGRW